MILQSHEARSRGKVGVVKGDRNERGNESFLCLQKKKKNACDAALDDAVNTGYLK